MSGIMMALLYLMCTDLTFLVCEGKRFLVIRKTSLNASSKRMPRGQSK